MPKQVRHDDLRRYGMSKGYVYILTNFNKTTLYIGITSNLSRRINEHYSEEGSKFTRKYKCRYLVYYEEFDRIVDAIEREKQLKNWHREWKLNLIKSVNPEMLDLSGEVF